MFYVYVLHCADSTLYVGYSEDIKARVSTHKAGRVMSTKYRLPATLVHYEAFVNKKDAKSREVFLKSGHGRKQIRDILKNTIDIIS